MVTNLLSTEEIDRDLEELILEKTEGIPFFIEEFIKSLKDLKIIETKDNKYYLAKDIQEVTPPSTIQDVIMARVDSLPEGAKELLQTGSVIEREFSHELIKRVTSLSQEELISHLSVLKDSELIYERGIYPESTYIFRHALTRQVVYDSILTKRKIKLHGEIGNAIEELYKDNIGEHCEVLAGHYITSEDYEKGAEYSSLAAKKARMGASFNDAVAYAEKRAVCLEKLPRTENVEKKVIDARVNLGLYYNQVFNQVRAKEAVEPIIELALKRDYKKRISHIYSIMGTHSFMVDGDYPKAFEYLEGALEIAEKLNDSNSLWMANHWIGHALAESCEFEKALYHLERCLKISLAANIPWSISVVKSCIANTVYNHQGRADLGYQTNQEGLRIAEESGDTLSKAEGHTSRGCSCYLKGFLDESEGHLLKGVVYSERINSFSWGGPANAGLGEIYFDKGEFQKSQGYYNKAISLLEHGRLWPSLINLYKVALVRAKVMNKEKDIDLESLYEYERENKMKTYDGTVARYISEILLNVDERYLPEAEDWIKKAIETDKRNGMMWWHLARDYAHYADLFKRKGDQLKAKENLHKAIGLFKECRADGWMEKAEKELASH
jgi:tetratricopeptide (TPR) repeat protein